MIAAGTAETRNNIAIFIPPVAPSRLDGCGIINVSYALRLKVCQTSAVPTVEATDGVASV